MSMSNLASALHDELDDELCAHVEGDEGHVLHDLSREHWEKMALQATEFISALWRRGELPGWVLSSLRSHAFGDCRVCGAAVDDPEAIYFCELPRLNCCGSPEGHLSSCETVRVDGLLSEDRSDIRLVPPAVREMWNPDSRRNRKFRER